MDEKSDKINVGWNPDVIVGRVNDIFRGKINIVFEGDNIHKNQLIFELETIEMKRAM